MKPHIFESKLGQLESYAQKTAYYSMLGMPDNPTEKDYLELSERSLIRKPVKLGLSIAAEEGMSDEYFRQFGVCHGLIERLQHANPLLELPDGRTVGAALKEATNLLGRFASVAAFFGATELFEPAKSEYLLAQNT